MRILVLNYEFPPVGGGGGRVAEELCGEFARRGHEVRICTARIKGLPRLEHREGFAVFRYPSLRRRPDTCTVWEMGAYLLLNWLPALRHAVRWKPDLVQVHFAVPTGVLGWLINLLTGIPYVLTVHLGDVPGGVPDQTDRLFRIVKPLTVPIWRRAAAVVAVGDFTRQLALKSYDVPVVTIHNGMDVASCTPSPPSPHTPVRLLYAGRFNPQKNLPFLIDLLVRVAELDWRMDMLGDGPLRGTLKSRIEQAGLSGRIMLHGWVTPEAISGSMSESDILILPSLSEGLSIVGIMALAHGLAILGSDIGGIAELVPDGANGILCPVNDLDAFERALRLMLGTGERLSVMKRASRKLAQEQFDISRSAGRYLELFEMVATAGKE